MDTLVPWGSGNERLQLDTVSKMFKLDVVLYMQLLVAHNSNYHLKCKHSHVIV